ncbi:MAG: HAMP domain-containing sensor histidine kinase [SAR324 cluster bacterium]|nr:HAMP domain-containing sensor histidine kinase [SAR324 cluster bacterium]
MNIPSPQEWLGNRSIFLKILMVILMAAMLVNFAVGHVFRAVTNPPRANFHRFVFAVTNALIEELGTPPSFKKAMKFEKDFSIHIYFIGAAHGWSTTGTMEELKKIHFPYRRHEMVSHGSNGERYFLKIKRPEGYYYFSPDFSLDHPQLRGWVLYLILMLSAIFFATLMLLRLIFRQVNVLKKGVEAVAQGDYEKMVEVRNNDELGQLSHAFNHMTKQVQGQMHSKEQLLLNVSHELRSPLTRMRIALEFLDDEKIKGKITKDILAMDGMLEELLESARLDSEHGVLKRRELSIKSLLLSVVADVAVDKSFIEVELPEEEILLALDEKRIRILLGNLIENALKYSKPEETPIKVILEVKENKATIAIKDFGEGIPDADLPHVFEPFYRVDKSRNQRTGGYGIGLSLCSKIAQAHKGAISVTSQVKVGTTFTLELPIGAA